MRYLILIHSNDEAFAQLSQEQVERLGRGHMALHASLVESGELVASEGLGDYSLAKFVSVRDGQTVASDGPFAEVKEHLAGFYLVDVEGQARAIEIAAQVPDAQFRDVEVRPVLDFSEWDI